MNKSIPPAVKTIPDLITWLADEHHEGHPSRMHAKLGISVATSNFWARGAVLPNLDNLERICDVYSLPFDQVLERWRKSRAKRRRGGMLGVVLALGLAAPGGPAAAALLPIDAASVETPPSPTTGRAFAAAGRYYVNSMRRWLARLVYPFDLVPA